MAGAGIEARIGGNWSTDLAYRFTDFGTEEAGFASGQTFQSDLTMHNVRLGLNYRLPGSAVDGSAPQTLPVLNDWAVYAQTTYVIQTDPDKLPNPGAEMIIEPYYAFPIARMTATLITLATMRIAVPFRS